MDEAKPTVFIVAEKPAIATEIKNVLTRTRRAEKGRRQCTQQASIIFIACTATGVYTFEAQFTVPETGQEVLANYRIASTYGHLFAYDFCDADIRIGIDTSLNDADLALHGEVKKFPVHNEKLEFFEGTGQAL